MALSPIITTDGQTVDPFETYATVKIPTAALRPGMLLVDVDLGTAIAALDHRVGTAPGGVVVWLVEDLETGRYDNVQFPATQAAAISVAAA